MTELIDIVVFAVNLVLGALFRFVFRIVQTIGSGFVFIATGLVALYAAGLRAAFNFLLSAIVEMMRFANTLCSELFPTIDLSSYGKYFEFSAEFIGLAFYYFPIFEMVGLISVYYALYLTAVSIRIVLNVIPTIF